MEHAFSLFISSCLLFWTILNVFKQFDRSLLGLSRYDALSLIPNWQLFAPNPRFTDYRLLYRDKFSNGRISSLQEIDWGKTSIYCSLWKGQSRESKFLSLLCKDAKRIKGKKIDLLFFYDLKFLMLKNFMLSYKKHPDLFMRQIIVVETFGYLLDRKERIIFVSEIPFT